MISRLLDLLKHVAVPACLSGAIFFAGAILPVAPAYSAPLSIVPGSPTNIAISTTIAGGINVGAVGAFDDTVSFGVTPGGFKLSGFVFDLDDFLGSPGTLQLQTVTLKDGASVIASLTKTSPGIFSLTGPVALPAALTTLDLNITGFYDGPIDDGAEIGYSLTATPLPPAVALFLSALAAGFLWMRRRAVRQS